ncbi:hypothetical protein SAMN04487843_104156 [Methylobacterium sp. ap11]|uniref:hypothetical protein n=1 Tax=Methylobacterium sp. ap11 TaxID=1761799 RepID=UPI0008C96DF1|nr:hypothetical protein [Methylobacterium sp. ap11]SEO84047.1 hypothetical protein SAMN04487843_104156 [Methylobacterium sp. ap11]
MPDFSADRLTALLDGDPERLGDLRALIGVPPEGRIARRPARPPARRPARTDPPEDCEPADGPVAGHRPGHATIRAARVLATPEN